MQNSGGRGVLKFFWVFPWGTKIFFLNFMGYEIFFGILEFHSAQVPGIKTDRSLNDYKSMTKLNHFFESDKDKGHNGGTVQSHLILL